MRDVHRKCVLICALVGFVTNAGPALLENYLVYSMHTDGLTDSFHVTQPFKNYSDPNASAADWGQVPFVDGDPSSLSLCKLKLDPWVSCDYQETVISTISSGALQGQTISKSQSWQVAADEVTADICEVCACSVWLCLTRGDPDQSFYGYEKVVTFHVINLASIIGWVVLEIALLMYFCAIYCCKVSWALDCRLVPLNPDRVFVATSLIRAAFELGNPDSTVMGVDPHHSKAQDDGG
jgi:hypothetical protein